MEKTLPAAIVQFLSEEKMKGQPVSYEEFQFDGGVKIRLCYYPPKRHGYIASVTLDRKPCVLDHEELIEHFLEVSAQLKANFGLTFV